MNKVVRQVNNELTNFDFRLSSGNKEGEFEE